jgi:Sulfotransferase family
MRGRRTAHFLHIGKSAGTAMKRALQDAPEPSLYRVVVHTHGVRMVDVPRIDELFFIVRDPIDRFVSGFDSRLRKGEPRFHIPWNEAEARAFADFPSPVELGLALAGRGAERARAELAMRSIGHVRSSYWDWFGSPRAFRRRENDILWIGFVEGLDEQMPELARRLGLPALELPSDDVTAHRSAKKDKLELPAQARDALAAWYRRDYEFLDLCRDLAARIDPH